MDLSLNRANLFEIRITWAKIIQTTIHWTNSMNKKLHSNFKEVKYEDTEIYQTYKMYLDRPYLMQERLFDESDGE